MTYQTPAAVADARAQDPYASAWYRYYALGLLIAAYTCNFLDRQVLTILQEPVKRELHLSDAQLGLLTGFGFACFYIILGLPVARWADRGVRRDITALAIGVWSLMTVCSGLARSYLQLLGARIAVGVGEAGGSPPAYSMLSDIFPARQRATALGAYGMGLNLGILTGFLAGGWLNQVVGWRAAFFVAGAPGLLIAILLRTTVAEPQRVQRIESGTDTECTPSAASVVRLLWGRRTFRHMVAGGSLLSFAAYGMFNWMPSFLVRAHGMTTAAVGTSLALIIGVGGAAATVGVAFLSDRLGRQDARWYAWLTIISGLVSIPLLVVALTVEDGRMALLYFAIPGAFAAVCVPPLMAVTHALVANRMRALSSAIVLFILNLVGLGLGPVTVGFVSDRLAPAAGVGSLRLAMLFLLPAAIAWGIAHFFLATRCIRSEMSAARIAVAIK
jgi:MFS family permease